MRVYIRDTERGRYYRADVSPRWAKRNNNGALISCGLSVPEDISRRQLSALHVTQVSYDEWNHSGCQSRCVLRGDDRCQW